MWSTSASSISTDTVPSLKFPGIINTTPFKTCPGTPYFVPNVKFDADWAFRVLQNPIPQKVDFESGFKNKDNELREENSEYQDWTKMHFQNVCLTLSEQRKLLKAELIEKNKSANHSLENSLCTNEPLKRPGSEFDKFVNRFNCYPNMVVKLPPFEISDYQVFREYFEQGIRLFHLNIRYGTLRIHSNILKHLQNGIVRNNIFPGLIIEIGDLELRTGLLTNGHESVYLDRDSNVILTADRKYSSKCCHRVIYVNFKDYVCSFQVDDKIRVGPEMELKVLCAVNISVQCAVMKDGLLMSDMEVFLPTRLKFLETCKPSSEEKDDICEAFHLNNDFFVCPHPLNLCTLRYIRKEQKYHHRISLVYAKVNLEKHWTISDLEVILDSYDGVWLQGRLINDARKYLADGCIKRRKQIISADVLDKPCSQIPNDEDFLKQILVYSDAIALKCNKTTPLKALNMLQKCKNLNKHIAHFSLRRTSVRHVEDILIQYVITTIFRAKSIRFIIISNDTARTIFLLSQRRTLVPIIACISNEELARQCSMLRNVYPLDTTMEEFATDRFTWEDVLNWRLQKSLKFAREHLPQILDADNFIFCFSSKCGMAFCDSFRIFKINSD